MISRFLLLLLTLSLAACSGVAGDICRSDDDCQSHLRCSSSGPERGVCTYPTPAEELGLDLPQSDGPLRDLPSDGPLSDLTSDGPVADSTVSDGPMEASLDLALDQTTDQQAADLGPDAALDQAAQSDQATQADASVSDSSGG